MFASPCARTVAAGAETKAVEKVVRVQMDVHPVMRLDVEDVDAKIAYVQQIRTAAITHGTMFA